MSRRSEPPSSSVPSLSLSGNDGTVWLDADAVWLEQGGTRRRIPIEAVEHARVGGRGGRSVEVVLWGVAGTPGPVFVVKGRDAAGAVRIVEAINLRRPQTGPLQGGESLVAVRAGGVPETAFRKKRRSRVQVSVVLVVYLGGIAGLALAGETFRLVMWATGIGPLALGALLLGVGLAAARRRLALKKRGVSVVARFSHGGGQKKYFRYTDSQGGEHEIVADYAAPMLGGGRPERIEVVYDPAEPSIAVCTLATRTLVWRTAGIVLLGVPFLLFGLFMTVGQLVGLLL